ncbi:MAG: 16S rRNA (guanine(527)-N(7))-methyltransferase RsmG [Clostridia bacterium]|nr:16S rRNA (guanine(527)-N(7))-methyltransferase RsmG [Clostridia bacterium]
MNISDTIRQVTAPWGVELDQTALQRCEKFADLLIEKNKVMNLTAITEEDKVARLHFADCLYLLSCCDFRGKKIIDVGCGGGFPSLPLLCAVPELDILGLDSTAKRINFVTESARELGVGGRFVAARAEEYALKNRERFDIATSRAVASLNVLLELTLPFLKVGGKLLAMKGMNELEDEDAKKALQVLGGKIVDIKTYSVGEDFPERRVVIVEKIRKTPDAYPRRYAKISAKPL